MNAEQAMQDTELVSQIDEVLKDFNKNTRSDLDLETGVKITFSRYNPEKKLLEIYVNPNPQIDEVSGTNTLLSLDLEAMNIKMDRYIPTSDQLFGDTEIRDHIKNFPNAYDTLPHYQAKYLSPEEKAIPLMAVKRYIFQSQGEFFNIAKKVLVREITREEIEMIIKSAESFLYS